MCLHICTLYVKIRFFPQFSQYSEMTTMGNTRTKPSRQAHEVAKDFVNCSLLEAKQNNEILTVGQLKAKLCKELEPWIKSKHPSPNIYYSDQDVYRHMMEAVFDVSRIVMNETRLELVQETECQLGKMFHKLEGCRNVGFYRTDQECSQCFVDTLTTVLLLKMRLLSFESSIATCFSREAERNLVSLLKHATTVFEPVFGIYFLQASPEEGREFMRRLLTMSPPELTGFCGTTYLSYQMTGAIDRRTDFLKELSEQVRRSTLLLSCKKSILKAIGPKRRHRAHELPLPEPVLEYLLSFRYY